MAHKFADLFSLEDLIPNLVKKKNTDKSMSIQKINSIEDYKKFLGQPYKGKIENDCSSYRIGEIQFGAIFQAFAYSLCVLACMNIPQLSGQIDYKQSFDLFQQHTFAFSVVFALYIYRDTNEVLFCTIEEFLKSISRTKICDRMEKSEYLDAYKQCGIKIDHVNFSAKEFSQEWYKSAAILLVYELHPCEYLGWWDDNGIRSPFKKVLFLWDYFSIDEGGNSDCPY